MFIILEHWYPLLHVRALLAQRKRGESAIHQLHDGPSFSSRSTSSRKDDLTDIDMIKRPGDKEYHTANQLKKKCKNKFLQGIHDRFTRDPEFRNRMIENKRDEELCRTWDALADEDHTHHLTP